MVPSKKTVSQGVEKNDHAAERKLKWKKGEFEYESYLPPREMNWPQKKYRTRLPLTGSVLTA